MALTNYYVDPSGGSDVTGNGTSGTPWKTVQKALDTIARDSTNGDQINVKAGALDALWAALSLTTYGTPTETAPLMLAGYTTAANDGGNWTNCGISGAGSYSIYTGANAFVHVKDMRLTNSGGAALFSGGSLLRCQCDTTTINGTSVTATEAVGCRFQDFTGGSSTNGLVNAISLWNTFANIRGTASVCVTNVGCVFDCSAWATAKAISFAADLVTVVANSIYGSANTVAAITLGSATTTTRHLVMNNIVAGFSGVGGKGISGLGHTAFVGHNAFYNNTANYGLIGWELLDLTANDIALGASPWVNAAGGDFRLTAAAVAALKGQRFPETFPGLASMVDGGAMGAWQAAPPAIADVRFGTAVGAVTGTAYIPAAADVQFGVNVDATTGLFVVPAEADVRDGTTYGAAAEFEGDMTSGGGHRMFIKTGP